MNPFLARLMFTVVAVVCCGGTGFGQSSQSPEGRHEQLAILPFTLHGVSAEEGRQLMQRFAEVMKESERFEVVPADSVKGIEGTSGARMLADAGKGLGVQKVVHIDVVRRGKLNVLRIRLVNASDAALLYAERVDFTGDRDSLFSRIIPEQARKLCSAHLDAKTPWGKGVFLFGACLTAIGWVFWHFRRKTMSSIGSNSGHK